jgi:putative flippase GtrA
LAFGGLGVGIDIVIYSVAILFGAWYQLANLMGYACGTLISFILNRAVTFAVKDQIVKRFFLFIGVATCGFLFTTFLLWLFITILSWDAMLSKVLTLPFVLMLQFTLNRLITFKTA